MRLQTAMLVRKGVVPRTDRKQSKPVSCRRFWLVELALVIFDLLSKISVDERDKAKFEELHRSIRACDDILSSVETNLTSFRNDLAAVSADIESLQARSSTLNTRLENRKAVEKGLGPIVEELSVSPMVVSRISEGHIDEAWIKVLADLDKRATSHKRSSQQIQSKAVEDIGPLFDKLILKVGSSPPRDPCFD